jgi:hypothetical protein
MLLFNIFFWFIFLNLAFFAVKAISLYCKNTKLLTKTVPDDVQAVSFHTYKPKKSVVPLRGKIIAIHACKIAKQLGVPIILSVGHTVPYEARTESEIYRDYIVSLPNCKEIKIITADNPAVRDTYGEVNATFQRCLNNGFKQIAVIALLPHLILRIIPYWQKANAKHKLKIYYHGILGPKKYVFWEFAMLISEFYFPPNSWQRKILFNFINRKG